MPRLLNLGSLCIDHVYQVDAIVVSGQTTASKGYEVHPGGKGLNQSLAAAKAGAEVIHAGAVGNDGRFLRDLLQSHDVNVDLVDQTDGASGTAIIQVDDAGANAIIIHGGANRTLPQSCISAVAARAEPGDWALLQNETNHVDRALATLGAASCQLAVNLAPCDGREQHYDFGTVDLLIVNEEEAAAACGQTGNSPKQSLLKLRERWPDTRILLTLGSEGLLYADREQALGMNAYAADAVDETAAGDAFIGFLMAALLRGAALTDALTQASAAGALAVTAAGAASSLPDRDAVDRFIAAHAPLQQTDLSV